MTPVKLNPKRSFTMAQNALLDQLATDPETPLTVSIDCKVWFLLMARMDTEDEIRMTTTEIAELVHASRPKVSEALGRLAEFGLVKKIRNGHYQLLRKAVKPQHEAKAEKAERKAHQARKEARKEAVAARTHLRAVN